MFSYMDTEKKGIKKLVKTVLLTKMDWNGQLEWTEFPGMDQNSSQNSLTPIPFLPKDWNKKFQPFWP